MINLEERIGNFTSSQVYRLKGSASVVKTYVEEKKAERALMRSADLGSYSQSMTYGKIMEAYLYSQEKYFPMASGWELCNKTTLIHPKIKSLAGSPDALEKITAGEIKCFYPKEYFKLANDMLKVVSGKMTLQEFKEEHPKVYWQVVCNAMIANKSKCAIFAYMPTLEELEDLILLIQETNFCEKIGLEPWMYRFITEAAEKNELYRLPYIDPSKTDFPNFVKLEFEPPIEDIIDLTKAILNGEKLLLNG